MSEVEKIKLESEIMYKEKELLISYALWFFLGGFGVHRFYLEDKKGGLWMLGLLIVGWLTSFILIGFIPLLILGVWWLYDGYKTSVLVDQYNTSVKQKKLAYLEEKSPVKVES